MPQITPSIRFGTCTWNYPSWVGLVYSRTQGRAAEYLPEYANTFDTAEIDSWFYHMPERREAKAYADAVPADFRFTCKVPESICLTHARTRSKDEELVPNPGFLSTDLFSEFLERIEPIAGKLDAIMFEFEYLNKKKMASLREFIDKLDKFVSKLPKGLPYALEPRNSNYMKEDYFKFIGEKGLIHVFSEKEFMPHVYEVYAQYSKYIGPKSVVRLMGGNRKEIEEKAGDKWDTIIEPKPDLEKVARILRTMHENAQSVTVNVNNHYEGSAPRTIIRLRDLLKN